MKTVSNNDDRFRHIRKFTFNLTFYVFMKFHIKQLCSALRQNWWAGYQIDIEDDIYIDNILPNLGHWLARLQVII